MIKKKKNGFAKRNSFGYILIGTVIVVLMLLGLIGLTAGIAPLVLSIHAGDRPAMMTMPILFYCIFIDFTLLEIMFLLFQPGAKDYIEDDKPTEPTAKKKMSGQIIIGIVCGVLLLCSVITAPCVCQVYTEDGISSYVFFKTDEVTWEDVGFYELEFTQEKGLSLVIHITREKSFSLFGTDVFKNDAFIEKYENEYGFANYLKQLAEQNGKVFRIGQGLSEDSLSPYYGHSPYWEQIKDLIQE